MAYVPFSASLLTLALLGLPEAPVSSPGAVVNPPEQQQALEDVEMILYQVDPHDRMTISIDVEGRDDLEFMIDTGAERSAISTEMADRLGYEEGSDKVVMTFAGLGTAKSVVIPSMEVAGQVLSNLEALTFREAAMGADGLLGMDSFEDRLVTFDFARRKIDVTNAPRTLRRHRSDDVIVDLEERSGRMVMTGAKHEKIDLDVMIDTGAGISVGNLAFKAALENSGKMPRTKRAAMLTVTGQLVAVDYGIIRNVTIDDITILKMPIVFALSEPFEELGLSEKPSIILGMGTLKSFGSMSIDYKNKRARFTAPLKRQYNPGSRFGFVEN